MKVQVKMDIPKLKSTINVLSEIGNVLISPEIVSAMMTWAKMVCDMAKRLVPVKTGALRDDINYFLFRRTMSIVQTKITTKPKDGKGKDHAFFLEFGTQPHWVAPKTKAALSWSEGGKRYFSKGHMVSGIRATRFMMRSYLATRSKGRQLLASAIRSYIVRKRKR